LAIIVPVLTTLVFGAWQVLLGPLLADIAREFGVDIRLAGLLLSVNFAGTLVSVMVGGYLADRYGKKRVFLAALGAFTGAILLFATGHSFTMIAAACLLAGGVGGSLEGLCGAVIADCDPARRDRNLNLLQMAFSAGAVLALVLASRLHALGLHWQTVYFVLGCAAVPVLLLAICMRVPPAPPGEPISLSIVRRVLTHPLILLLALAIALYVGAEMGLAQWITRLLVKAACPPATAMLAPALFWGMTGVGRLISGALCLRYSGLRVLSWLLLGGCAAFAVLLLPPDQRTLWIGTGLAGLAFSGIWPLLVSLASSHFPSYSGTTVALMVVASNVGGMIFPALAGFIIEQQGAAASARLWQHPSWWGIVFFALQFLALVAVCARYVRARTGYTVHQRVPVVE